MMSIFESDDEDSIELFDLGEDNVEKELKLDSEDDENVSPNASHRSVKKISKSPKGVDLRSARNPGRRRQVTDT